jgi:hypothetical protein
MQGARRKQQMLEYFKHARENGAFRGHRRILAAGGRARETNTFVVKPALANLPREESGT